MFSGYKKYIFIFVVVIIFIGTITLFLSSKSRNTATLPTPENIANISDWDNPIKERGHFLYGSVLWFMGISESESGSTYTNAQEFLQNAESSCLGKDFKAYRACFVEKISLGIPFSKISKPIQEKVKLFARSLEKEIQNMEHYEVLNSMPRKIENESVGSGSICRTINIKAPYGGRPISYLENKFPKLSEIFQVAKKRNTYDFLGDPDYYARIPCKSYTWGPDIRNIIDFYETPNFWYLFMKTGDGAGSGEFNYSIFTIDTTSKHIENIGSFGNLIGIPPFIDGVLNQKDVHTIAFTPLSITQAFSNLPFLYADIFASKESDNIILFLEDQIR